MHITHVMPAAFAAFMPMWLSSTTAHLQHMAVMKHTRLVMKNAPQRPQEHPKMALPNSQPSTTEWHSKSWLHPWPAECIRRQLMSALAVAKPCKYCSHRAGSTPSSLAASR